ncbi:hypothetical protein ZIOFF_043775 [Zingiber officinale]|uniref:F-box domain-containing protein n=1 Tax=Zingiber officinale TaxID=94328 RepID=A0A8J5KU55_ZINOF|nr:hypothetical protein ZIOFF_043775 [Zingiber officinale]
MGSRTVCYVCSESNPCKRRRVQFDGEEYSGEKACLFDRLPDDIVLSILCCLSASAERPSDLVSVMTTCKRMNRLGKNPLVLEKATLKSFSIRGENWSPQAHKFLERCADAGNVEACYLFGMVDRMLFLGDTSRSIPQERRIQLRDCLSTAPMTRKDVK